MYLSSKFILIRKILISEKLFHCNCNKSKCEKKYCECYANNEPCDIKCDCCNCHNCDSHKYQHFFNSDCKIEEVADLTTYKKQENSNYKI